MGKKRIGAKSPINIGTTAGILRYDRFTFITVNTANAQMMSDEVTALHCDSDDNLWIGTKSSSLSMIRYISMKNYKIFSTPGTDDYIVSFQDDAQFKTVLVMAGGNRLGFINGRLEKAGERETAVALIR